MITLFAILAMLADYGYSNFPTSTLNWWTMVFTSMALVSTALQLFEVTTIRHHLRTIPLSLIARPLAADLLFTTTMTIAYLIL